VDEQTIQAYSNNHAEFIAKYDSACGGIADYFATSFPSGAKVLDIGCGSGRDLRILHEMGYTADGIDPCPEFVESISNRMCQYGATVEVASLPSLKSVEDGSYDAVLCSAVLMHLPEEQLFDAAFSIRRIFHEKGRLLISIPLQGEGATLESDGRLFNGVSPDQIELLFERIGFRLISRWDSEDALGRAGRQWASLLFELESRSGSRPIDTIESVLNKDRKVATYKLALFRSLAEIAVTNYNLAEWTHSGRIKVPISALADKWVEYYWPIIESDKNIPQNTGKPITFRTQLDDLVQYYKKLGGISSFSAEYRNGELSTEGNRLHRLLLQKVKTAIKQPVYHAGGGEHLVFQYDPNDRTVLVGCDIWKELSLMGTWIQDATILRWAELTAKISGDRIKPSDVIDCLLTVPETKRVVHAAKKFYDSLADKRCVWSDQSILREYDLDHAIPFSLWKNNDLWNLLPANSKVNGKKRDKLPEQELIKRRRDCIVDYWSKINDAYPARFKYEAEKFVGIGNFTASNWENRLFSTFSEAIEITAIQRGIERWNIPAASSSTAMMEQATQKISLVVHDEIDVSEQYSSCVPFFSLQAAAGAFSDGQEVEPENEPEGWVEVDTFRRLEKGMFVAQVVGHSMEPRIPDGSFCLFQSPVTGSRSGRIVLVQHHEISDPDHGGRYTVKQYESTKRVPSDESQLEWGHESIVFKPFNKDYDDIPFEGDPEDLIVVAEFLEVLDG